MSKEIVEIPLNRPPANALNPDLVAHLRKTLQALPAQGARAAIFTGNTKIFCGGLDVPALLPLDRKQLRTFWFDFLQLYLEIGRSPIPLAAAITGHAPAGGLVLSMFCDYRVMARGNFRIGLNEVALGIPLPKTIFLALQNIVGPRTAERMSAEAFLFGPEQALEHRLIDELVATEEVVPRATAWAQSVLALPATSFQVTRKMTRQAFMEKILAEDLDQETDRILDVWFGGETQGKLRELAARLEKK